MKIYADKISALYPLEGTTGIFTGGVQAPLHTGTTGIFTGGLQSALGNFTSTLTGTTGLFTGGLKGQTIHSDKNLYHGYTGLYVLGDPTTNSYGWKDNVGQIIVRATGAGNPTWTQIAASSFWAYKVAINDAFWGFFHINHDFLVGSSIFPHVHYLTDGTNVNTVKWQYEITQAAGYSTEAYNLTGTTKTSETGATGIAYTHYISETTGYTGVGLVTDAVVMVKYTRIANGGTDNTDGVFVTMIDLHYQSDRISTKNRNSPFYS
jgi:hypothetical protein